MKGFYFSVHKKKSGLLSVVMILFVFVIMMKDVSAQIIFEDSFESGVFDTTKWDLTWWTDRQLPDGIRPEIVTSPVREGKYAVKIRDEYQWHGVKEYNRTEIQARREDTGIHHTFFDVNGGEYWIGFSIYLPPDWKIDSQPEVVFQLHGNGAGRVPPFALYIDGDKWGWIDRWQPKRDTVGFDVAGEKTLWEGKYEKGEWVDWVIHAKWSFKDDGFLEIYKNGKTIARYDGPNCYNDALWMRGPQTGIYKWGWREIGPSDVKERTVYLDAFKVCGKDGSYKDVAPNCGVR